jgi:glucosyl-3-phosphoglycerate synthase
MREAVDTGIVQSATVLDSGSSDSTADIAKSHGVATLQVSAVRRDVGEVLGKGDSLWRGVQGVSADAYVFLDADLGNVSVRHIEKLVDTFLDHDDVMLVKGAFRRVDEHGAPRHQPAGRVSEEVGFPLLALVDEKLTTLRQPLSGQVVVRADALLQCGMVTGYGIEIAMLIDVWRSYGANAIVEADLGDINNRWKHDDALDDVRDEVLAGAALCGVVLPSRGDVSLPNVVRR